MQNHGFSDVIALMLGFRHPYPGVAVAFVVGVGAPADAIEIALGETRLQVDDLLWRVVRTLAQLAVLNHLVSDSGLIEFAEMGDARGMHREQFRHVAQLFIENRLGGMQAIVIALQHRDEIEQGEGGQHHSHEECADRGHEAALFCTV